MLATARDFVGGDLFEPWRFKDVDLGVFLENYLWVIFVSGFRNAVVEKHFETLKEAFHGLDLDKIVAMGSIDADNLPIANQRKADAFIEGCRLIKEEGWKSFKKRLRKRGRAALLELPWMGPATSQHLALVLGVEDTEKADTWIKQCAQECEATVDQMVTYLTEESGLTRQQVDGYLWRYCKEKQHIPP